MAEKAPTESKAPILSAEQLRIKQLEAQMKDMEQQEKARETEKEKLATFADDFLKNHISDDERGMIRRLVDSAAQKGLTEAMVYSFPSELCTDGGRAINNSEANWPDTLQGKAKHLFDAFKTRVQPEGYKLKAMIINFPGGIPGDVGFFLNWSAPEKAPEKSSPKKSPEKR